MIVKIVKEIPLYEQFGVFTEAPKTKRKKRIIKGSAPRSLKDFNANMEPDEIINAGDIELDDIDPEDFDDMTQGAETDEELEDDTIQTDDTGEDIPDDMDFTTDMETEDQEIPPEETGEEQPVDAADGEQEDMTANMEEDPTAQEQPAEGDATGEPQVTDQNQPVDGGQEQPAQDQGTDTELDLGDGGGDDFTAGGEEGQPQDPNAMVDPNGMPVDPNAPQAAPPATKDDMRKFILYKKFMSLNASLVKYLESIEEMKLDNQESEKIKNDIIAKFNNIQDLIKDYMIMKYSTDSYVQCTLFYEKMRTATLLLFEKLKVIINNKKTIK